MPQIDLAWNFRTPEQDTHFFKNSVKCLGMTADLKPNHCYVPYAPNNDVIILGDDTAQVFYNTCPHKHSQLYKESCSIEKRIVCPIHRWSFDHIGNFIVGRGFDPSSDKNLIKSTAYNWQGFIMSGDDGWVSSINSTLNNDLKYFQGHNYKMWKQETLVSSYDWKIFYEIYLDLYHVRSCHPSLKNVIDINNFQYAFGDGWSCQYAYLNDIKSSATKKTEVWLTACDQLGLLDNSFKLLCVALYPNVMLESYPGCNIISQVYPHSSGKNTSTVQFYFDENILKKNPNFAQLTYDFWMETAVEDEEISKLMQLGRGNLLNASSTRPQFDHPTEETANTHWFEWMKQQEKLYKDTSY